MGRRVPQAAREAMKQPAPCKLADQWRRPSWTRLVRQQQDSTGVLKREFTCFQLRMHLATVKQHVPAARLNRYMELFRYMIFAFASTDKSLIGVLYKVSSHILTVSSCVVKHTHLCTLVLCCPYCILTLALPLVQRVASSKATLWAKVAWED